MELLSHVAHGFSVALLPANVFAALLGCLLGTVIGVLPGIGPATTIALLLPITYAMSPVAALIMVAGIYYGAMYGGSTTSVLVNIPGEAASVVTCLDGYQMARQGRAGPALGMCAFASFIAGTVGVLGLMLLAPFLASVALQFGPPEYVVLVAIGLLLAPTLTTGSKVKGLIMVVVGLLLGAVGMDPVTGYPRFTFETTYLLGGIDVVVVIIGLFGIAEVLANLGRPAATTVLSSFSSRLADLMPNRQDWRESRGAIVRGSLLGFFLGLLPGGGAITAPLVAYAVEKKVSKMPEHFGAGAIAGVAAPEAANNSAATGAFVPLLTLGIPFNAVTALMMTALMIHGVRPSPLLMQQHPEIFWGVIASMYLGNAVLLALNLPLVGVFVQLLRIPYPILFPLILLFAAIGAYSLNNSVQDVFAMIGFGVAGYLLQKAGFEPAPLVLAVVLGPMLESAFRQSLILSHGSFAIFVSRPVSGAMVVLAAGFLFASLALKLVQRRQRLWGGILIGRGRPAEGAGRGTGA